MNGPAGGRMFSFADSVHIRTILDEALGQALKQTRAEACFAYLPESGGLKFAGLRTRNLPERIHAHMDASGGVYVCPLAELAAIRRQTLNLAALADVRPNLSMPEMPLHSVDIAGDLALASGTPAASALIVPAVNRVNGEFFGVILLLNKLDDNGGKSAFSGEDQAAIEGLALDMARASGLAQTISSVANGFIEAVALRDPGETTAHSERVAAISAEIYHHMAVARKINSRVMRQTKDQLRVAAMLHDIGKVGIPEYILQKPGCLTREERAIMERHCVIGAKLFAAGQLEIDRLVRDVALYHHQRWDGRGYTGDPDVPNLRGDEIPLAARIVAVADVYDALVSRRCYKAPWEHEAAVTAIKSEVGTHFDAGVVDAFILAEDVIEAIENSYADRSLEGVIC